MRKCLILGVLLAFGSIAAFTSPSLGGEKKGAKGQVEKQEAKGDDAKDVRPEKESESDKALEQIALAGELIAYGRANKAPEALLLAAGILHQNQAELVKGEPDKVDAPKEGGAKDAKQEKEDPRAGTAAGLLEEAKEMAGDDAAIKGLIAKTEAALREAPRGATSGARYRYGYINAKQGLNYYVQFRGGAYGRASVIDNSYPYTQDLDLYIYRYPSGSSVTSDTRTSTSASCSWYVPYTQSYRIRVYNYSSRGTYYRLYHN